MEFKPEVCYYLLKRLRIENEENKITIIRIFRIFNNYESAETLKTILHTTTNKDLIIEVIKYAGQIESLESVETIKEFLDYPDSEIRLEAGKAIAKIAGDSESLRISVNLYDTSWQVQIETAEVLSKLKPKGLLLLNMVASSNTEPRAASVAQMVLSELNMEVKPSV